MHLSKILNHESEVGNNCSRLEAASWSSEECAPRTRIIRFLKPMKLGAWAPWVRHEMRFCEWVAKTWRYFVLFFEL